MTSVQELAPTVEGLEDLSINSVLLEHYTSLTEHHRAKLSILGTAYLVIAQLMLLTPVKSVHDAVESTDRYLFAVMLGAIISLVVLGLLHHAANLAVIAGQRLNVLRNIYWSRLPKELNDPDEYTEWRLVFEDRHRDTTSVSRPSLIFLTVLVVPVFALTITRYHSIVGSLLSGEAWIYLVLGIFYALQAVLFMFYLVKIWKRALHFGKIRDVYKVVQGAKSRNACLQELTGNFTTRSTDQYPATDKTPRRRRRNSAV